MDEAQTGPESADSKTEQARIDGVPATGRVSRRSLMTGFAAGAGAMALAACSGSDNAEASGATGTAASKAATGSSSASTDAVIDRIRKAGTAKIGVDLTFTPLQFRDDDDNPTGYTIELFKMMMADLEVEPEWVDTPFTSLIPSLVSGQIDMCGLAVTNLPSRALEVSFAGIPAFLESEVILLKPDSNITSMADLNSPDVTIAVQIGSSQEAAAPGFFPNANFKSLENEAATADVASGRSDAKIASEFGVKEVLEANPGMKVLDAPPLFVDYNTYFVQLGDFRSQEWITNWLSYQMAHGRLQTMWQQWVGDDVAKIGLKSTPVVDVYTGAAVALGLA